MLSNINGFIMFLLTKPSSSCYGLKDVGVCEDDFYGNLGMDEVDLALDNYEELFGTAFNTSVHLFGQGGVDSIFQKHHQAAPPEVRFPLDKEIASLCDSNDDLC